MDEIERGVCRHCHPNAPYTYLHEVRLCPFCGQEGTNVHAQFKIHLAQAHRLSEVDIAAIANPYEWNKLPAQTALFSYKYHML